MRKRFETDLRNKGFRFISGRLTNLPDIDLAIVNDSEKVCLLLELKWFIAPTVAREQIEKSEEIQKGVRQSLRFKQAFANNHRQLLDKLKIDSSYLFDGIVVSENWIGYANVQSPEVPIIRAEHLVEKLKAAESLQSAMKWLRKREYLPKEGKHFKKVDGNTTKIGDWSLKLHQIELLSHERFFPL